MKTEFGLMLTAALVCFSSCSVKENRKECPAWCVVASDGYVADNYRGKLLCNLSSESRPNLGRSNENFSDFENRGKLVLEVPRNENVYVDVFSGVNGMRLDESLLVIGRGCCCDSVYAGHSVVYVTGDETVTELPLNKEFATMLLKIIGLDSSPYYFTVRGNVDGYSIPGCIPHRGTFEYSAPVVEGEACQVRLPRQLDDSLQLEIAAEDGSIVATFPLGRAIADQGYDWTSADLRDFAIGADICELKFMITIEAWDGSRTITITL